ncbi:uncharacterized protein LOC114598564 [Podarcis muralis]
MRSIPGSEAGSKSRASFADSIGDAASGMSSVIGGFFGGSSGNSAQPEGDSGTTNSQPDAMYLIVKVDLVSSGPVTISALNQPLLKEVQQMLAGFLKGTFHLTWVTYKENK